MLYERVLYLGNAPVGGDYSSVIFDGHIIFYYRCKPDFFRDSFEFCLDLKSSPPQLSKTGRSEAVTPENPQGSTVTHPERHVQAALSRAARHCGGRRRRAGAAAIAAGEERWAGWRGAKCLLFFLYPSADCQSRQLC